MKVSKLLIFAFAFIALPFSFFLIQKNFLINLRQNPQPTETIVVRHDDEDDEEDNDRTKREAWINFIHKTAPDVNWKALDRQARLERYVNNNNGFQTKSTIESFANNTLTGSWNERGSLNQAGRTHIADYDTATQKIYVATSGGNVWRGNKNGTNWEVLNDRLRFENIVMLRIAHKGKQKRIMATSGGKQFFYSDDQGNNWETATGLENIASNGYIARGMLIDDLDRTVLLLVNERINNQVNTSLYRSNDFGNSFQRVANFQNSVHGNTDSWDLWAPYYNEPVAFLLNNNKLYKFNFDENTLNQISTLPSNPNGLTMLTGNVINNQIRLHAIVNQMIYKSTNGGNSWSQVGAIDKNPFFKISFSASVTLEDVLYFGDVECFKSTNAGSTWTRVNEWGEYYQMPDQKLHADIPSVNALLDENGQEFLLINTDGGLYVSYDQLQFVNNLSLSGLNISQYYSSYTCKFDTRYIYLGSQDQGYQRTNAGNQSGALNFTQVISGDYGHLTSSDEGNTIWTVYPGFAMYFADAFTSNPSSFYNFPTNADMLWLPPIIADVNNVNIAYLAGGAITGNGSHIIQLVSTGGNISATQLPFNFRAASGGGTLSALNYSQVDPNYWYAMTSNGRFFRSTDAGANWTMTSNNSILNAHYFYGHSILPSKVNPGEVYIAGSGYSNPGVFKSTDNGATFSSMNQGLPNTMIYRIDCSPKDEFIFAATELGPYVYARFENRWFELNGTQAPDQVYWNVEYVEPIQTARFVTYGRGVWDFKIETGLKIDKLENKQTLTIFPNPAESLINIQMPKNAKEIAIYSITGKLIERISPENENIRQFEISSYKNGAYLVVVNTAQGLYTGKFIKK